MAKSISVTTEWGDGVYTFRLGVVQLEEHDEKCGAGPLAVLGALVDGTARIPYWRETIRLGLIGGGLSPVAAAKLVHRYVDERPIIESFPYAVAILSAAVRGEDPEPGKQTAATSETGPTGSTSPQFAEPPAPSASAEPI